MYCISRVCHNNKTLMFSVDEMRTAGRDTARVRVPQVLAYRARRLQFKEAEVHFHLCKG